MNCLKLKNQLGVERLVPLGQPYTVAPGEVYVAGQFDCDGKTPAPKQPNLAQELNAEIGMGMGDFVKVLASPIAKLIGKDHCTVCEAKRVLLNHYGALKDKHGLIAAVSIMKDIWAVAKTDPDAALAKLKESL